MQRVLHRRLLARNQALKGSRRQTEKQVSEDKRKARQDTLILARAQRSIVKAERINRHDDWMLGSLAPNRAAGKDGGSYGMLDFQHIRAPLVEPAKREDYFNFAVDDRVAVVKGRESGKIGTVSEVDEERQSVTIRDVNLVSI
jgi:large subunit ribosomal protein L24